MSITVGDYRTSAQQLEQKTDVHDALICNSGFQYRHVQCK